MGQTFQEELNPCPVSPAQKEQENDQDGFAGLVERTLDIQILSSPKLSGIESADDYSSTLRKNYMRIGELSLKNRELISTSLMPMLESEGSLNDEEVASLRELSDMMLDASTVESVDIFFRDLINKRLMQDARSRNDDAYIIRELDKELENNCILATQMARITSDPSIFSECLKRAIDAHDELMTYLEPSRFESLDIESRETVMVDARYGVNAIWGIGGIPIKTELRQRRIRISEKMMLLADDPFYRNMLPDYDWDCHRLRCLEYIVSSPGIEKTDGYDHEEMARISAAAHEYETLWNSNPEKYAELTDKSFVIDSVNLVYYLNRELNGRIMAPEFNLIRQHPSLGAEIMAEYPSTRDYVDVTLGHHRWYNDQGGYPASFQTKGSPVKIIIDIVACADCMDAATDRIGRSYSDGEDLDGFLAELSEGAGTRYAPYLPELLSIPEVRRDIEFLLAQGRQDIYKKTYNLLKTAEGVN